MFNSWTFIYNEIIDTILSHYYSRRFWVLSAYILSLSIDNVFIQFYKLLISYLYCKISLTLLSADRTSNSGYMPNLTDVSFRPIYNVYFKCFSFQTPTQGRRFHRPDRYICPRFSSRKSRKILNKNVGFAFNAYGVLREWSSSGTLKPNDWNAK